MEAALAQENGMDRRHHDGEQDQDDECLQEGVAAPPLRLFRAGTPRTQQGPGRFRHGTPTRVLSVSASSRPP